MKVNNKEYFKESDILKYEELNRSSEEYPLLNFVNVEYLNEDVKHIKIPGKLFTQLINVDRADLLKFLPYTVKIDKLERGDNFWLKNTNYLGLQDIENGILTLKLAHDQEHSVISLLWILLHEFRHKVQYFKPSVLSNIDNNNLKLWLDYMISKGNDENLLKHVFHEIFPFEIDANTFACEMLDIEYPGSKFEITEETLKMLK